MALVSSGSVAPSYPRAQNTSSARSSASSTSNCRVRPEGMAASRKKFCRPLDRRLVGPVYFHCIERYRKIKCKEKPMTTTRTTESEADAIAKTVQIYVDGGRSGRGDDMKAAFHPDATIFGYLGNDLFAGPIQKVFDRIDQNGPATELEWRIASLDICETIATVRLELDNWTGHRYTDMLALVKVEGEWKIIRKVFYMHS